MRLSTTFLFALFSFVLFAQSAEPGEVYSQAKIDLSQTDIRTVAALGLEVDHGHYAKGKHLINVFSQRELALLATNNIPFEVLVPDAKADYLRRVEHERTHGHSHGESRSADEDCVADTGGSNYVTPENYTYGSMGGYHTYDEVLAVLDDMAAQYPNLITPKMQIGESVSNEGRPIWHLRLSDNPLVDEDEPEVLYTALHHAREPNGLSQMLFYIWYLLENYATDPEVKYLVDNTEMYFVPVVNPDGYVYNELTDPNGGGFWRKNRRDNGDGTMGVDLNRNYGYEWGFDDQGSSPNPQSDVYRGTEGFSEPETSAVRDLCNAHEFRIALNYHTFGNLLIYPWGFSDEETPDQATFRAMTEAMTRENDYLAGTGSETVGYTVNGDSDDWLYGEETTKPKIFSMTPEVGPNFWPTQGQIDGLNKDCMLQNLVTAHLLLNYGEVEEIDGEEVLTELNDSITLQLKKYGLMAGELTLTVSGLDNNITMVGNNSVTLNMEHLDESEQSFPFFLSDQLEAGTEVAFLVSLDNGGYVATDTLRKTFGESTGSALQTIYADNGTNVSLWESQGEGSPWNVTTEDFTSSPSSRTDSPFAEYEDDQDKTYTLLQAISLENMSEARLEFMARWDIENNYDFVQIMISTDGVNFTPLCGQYTNLASNQQPFGEPLYDGEQAEWVKESISLDDYLGQSVLFRFYFYSDGAVEEDGFYFDDFEVLGLPIVSSISENDARGLIINSVAPNPFTEMINVALTLDRPASTLELKLVDPLGRTVLNQPLGAKTDGIQRVELRTEKLANGIYFLQVFQDGELAAVRKVVK
ncbi:hypothetical protein CEQ90_18445 [Lewinellaceae bacterium SD302]|nr:hypothetical protein CEQ90_18445 [Lewinellaceae bacterium SD302]